MALGQEISAAIRGGRTQAFLSDGVDFVVIDVVMDFSEDNSYQISRHTIEDGADISDHIDAKPRKWSFNGVLTDDDFDLLDPEGFFDATIEDRFEILEKYRIDKSLLTYYGHETDIENVAITSLQKTKNMESGAGWMISVGLTKINVSTFQTESIDLSSPTAKGKTPKGTKSNTQTPTTKKSQSLLKGLLG